MKKFVMLLTTLSFTAVINIAHAEFFVCGDSSQFTQAFYIDPTFNKPGNCSQVADSNVTSQQNVIASVGSRKDYLKVVSGAVVVKTQVEKDAVDAVIAVQQAVIQAAKDEANVNNALCSAASLQQIKSKVQALNDTLEGQIDEHQATTKTAIDSALTLVLAQTALTTINTEHIAAMKQMKNTLGRAILDITACVYAKGITK